jgi:hypothetical protein
VTTSWNAYSSLTVARSVSPLGITLVIEDDPQWNSGIRPTAPPDWALGGCSGAPLLSFIDYGALHGWELGGVIYECGSELFSNGTDRKPSGNYIVKASRADFINPDGSIDINPPDKSFLVDVAVAARQTLKQILPGAMDIGFSNFPHGSCADTSELLARYMREALDIDALYVAGEKQGRSHAWVVANSFVVDITADQFGQPPIIVARYSTWHQQWEQEAPRQPMCTLEEWPEYPLKTWKLLADGMIARGFSAPRHYA